MIFHFLAKVIISYVNPWSCNCDILTCIGDLIIMKCIQFFLGQIIIICIHIVQKKCIPKEEV